MLAKFKNSSLTTISSSIDATQTSIAVTDPSVFPIFNSSNGEYFLAIITDSITNYEIVKVTNINNNTLTVIRGFESTTAKSFSSGTRIINKLTAGFLNSIESGGASYIPGTGISIVGNTISLAGSIVGAGTYNNVSVDQYGRVIFGSLENYDYSAGTGININSRTISLAGSIVTPGSYDIVTVDQYGRVTSGSAGGGGEGGESVYIQNDDTTNSEFYPTFSSVSSGTLSTANVSSSKLQFNPSTGNLSSVIFTSLSDINSKTNIESLNFEYCSNVIVNLNPVSFNWKDTGLKSYGLIAQEVENILPEIINTSNDNVKTINYSALIPFLLAVVQYLIKKI